MAPITIDYAAAYGYNSLAAAIVFTIAYIPPSVWFVFKAFKNFTRVWIILVLFTQSMYKYLCFACSFDG